MPTPYSERFVIKKNFSDDNDERDEYNKGKEDHNKDKHNKEITS